MVCVGGRHTIGEAGLEVICFVSNNGHNRLLGREVNRMRMAIAVEFDCFLLWRFGWLLHSLPN